ncbi:type VI immunity family protein [Paraburkholderia adhaesiva]|uniref:type VI immunity family protein n=1 Tax=Paraburkholderia adhaesiva TaxID=2883244 RepID=UPI001F251C1B|nr:type VI immunity family protein [Paraburkholderia adhaesiva]
MSSNAPRPVLTPEEALQRYREELCLHDRKGRLVVLPGVIGTVFFRGGSTLEVRKGILACFDRFAELFGEYMKGGRGPEGTGNFGRRTPAGIESIRRAIVETPSYEAVEAVLSSTDDPDAAPAYQIGTLTSRALAEDYQMPGSPLVHKKGTDRLMSYLKFWMPMDFVNTPEGVRQYEAFLRFVCQQLPVCGGYGGLSAILPYDMHGYLSQEWVMAQRFRGLEIDSYAFLQGKEYLVGSYEGKSMERMTAIYDDLHPGAKVARYGYVKSVNWYTLIGDLFVDRLGGEEKVRAELARPDINIERIGKCLLIRAGDFPWLGAPEEAWSEPYLVVNSVLRVLRNPDPQGLQTNVPGAPHADREGTRRWEARFDYRDAPPPPPTPLIVPLKTN